jgi:hypothetical protein
LCGLWIVSKQGTQLSGCRLVSNGDVEKLSSVSPVLNIRKNASTSLNPAMLELELKRMMNGDADKDVSRAGDFSKRVDERSLY